MGWRDTIIARPASFRGVPFFVGVSDRAGGRRDVKHEFPQRDLPFFEDLGKVTTAFSISGHVLGNDYLAKRDALIDALEDVSSIGTLQHPYYGRKRVKARSFSVSESTREGGIARFSMTFEEAEEPSLVTVEDVAGEIATVADGVNTVLEDFFAGNFSVEGMSSFFVDQAGGWVEDLAGLYSDSMQFIQSTESFAQDTAIFIQRIDNLAEQAIGFVNDPASLISEITTIFDDLTNISDAVNDLFNFSEAASTYGDDYADLPETTSTRITQANNRAALIEAVKAGAVASQAKFAGEKEYESQTEAATDRDNMLEQIEEITLEVVEAQIFQALSTLKAPIIKIVNATLTKLIKIEQPTAIPEPVLSWKLYSNSEQELTRRNGLYHPGFLVGSLEVLSDV